MQIHSFGWQAVLLTGLLVATAIADDQVEAKPRAWKQGELVEVHYTSKGQLREEAGGERYTTTHALTLVVVDRIDEVVDGRVVAITRHVTSVKLLEDGEDVDGLSLQGRNVTLRRSAKGHVNGTYPDGERVTGEELRLVRSVPFPDLDAAWRLDLGSRKGELGALELEGFEPGNTPAFVVETLKESGLQRISSGSWELTVSPGFALAGKVSGKLRFAGEEKDDEGGAYTLDRTLEVGLTRKAPAAKELPRDTPPAEEEANEDWGDEDMDDGPGEPEDDDPMPEDDDDPDPEPAPEPEDEDEGY